MKIDFSRMEIFTDVSRKHTVVVDMRKPFANTIYQNGSGIGCINNFRAVGVGGYFQSLCLLAIQRGWCRSSGRILILKIKRNDNRTI